MDVVHRLTAQHLPTQPTTSLHHERHQVRAAGPVLHEFADTTVTMRAKVPSLFTVVDASGPEMDRGETVTVFNDLVMLTPGAIADAPDYWSSVDAHHVHGAFTDGDQTASADLTCTNEHGLVDFVSEDRFNASAVGTSSFNSDGRPPYRAAAVGGTSGPCPRRGQVEPAESRDDVRLR